MIFDDVLAWAASASCLVAYGLMSRRPQHLRLFNRVNLVAGVILLAYGLDHHTYPPAALSGAYALIALRALVKR